MAENRFLQLASGRKDGFQVTEPVIEGKQA